MAVPVLCGALMAGLVGAKPGAAQGQAQILRIAAVVNDDIVSALDLNLRVDLQMLASGLQATPELTRRLGPQVLNAIIEEKLILQEMAAKGVTISEEEARRAAGEIDQRLGRPPGTVLRMIEQQGLPTASFLDQQRARLGMQLLAARRVRATRPIGEDEIDQEIARQRAYQGRPEYLAADIFLPAGSADNGDVLRTAERLIEQLRGGASFPALAQQFSASAAARTGGDLGWVREGQLDPALEAALTQLQPSGISAPVRTIGGWHILLLRDKRIASGPDIAQVRLTLAQAIFPLPRRAPPAVVAGQRDLAQQIGEIAVACSDFQQLGEAAGARVETADNIRMADLNPAMRPMIEPLGKGKASAPVVNEAGVLIAFVCERDEAAGGGISRDQVRERLFIERLESEARKYVRDLRQAATVDIRL